MKHIGTDGGFAKMAVQWNVEASRTSEYRIFPEDISVKPELNGRHDNPDIEWLIQDILRNGQIQPVSIRNDGGQPVLCAGFSRWRAISEINKRKLAPVKMQVRCTYMQSTEHEGFLANIAENRFRNSTTTLDDAFNIKRLMKNYAMTEERVAAIYFPMAKSKEEIKQSLAFVRKRVTLVGLSKESQAAMRSGRMRETAAVAIAKLSQEQQKEVIEKAGEGNIRKPSAPKNGKPTLGSVKAAIAQVIETGKFLGLGDKPREADDHLVAWLGRLIGE